MNAAAGQVKRELSRTRNEETRRAIESHLNKDVLMAVRCFNLAFGFWRGRKYRQIERSARKRPDWEMVHKIIQEFRGLNDEGNVSEAFAAWLAQADLEPSLRPKGWEDVSPT
jgi:hypothetical protein